MGGSRECNAERGVSAGIGKNTSPTGGYSVPFWWRSAPAGSCDIYGSGRTAYPDVRVIWSLFYVRRSIGAGSNECCGRLWGVYAGSDLQPFWKRRKGISFSTGVCQSETIIRALDSDRKWCIYRGIEKKPCTDHRSNGREDCRLRIERFAEHGSMYGAGSL